MILKLTPELGTAMPTPSERIANRVGMTVDVYSQCKAVQNSHKYLSKYGKVKMREVTKEDMSLLSDIVQDCAETAEGSTKMKTSVKRLADDHPAVLMEAGNILRNFGRQVARDATEVRNLVVNKLLLESDNPDPKVRLKAIELLGKLSDVGAFTEKSEITVTHQTSDQLRDQLRKKLQKLVGDEPIEDVEYEELPETDQILSVSDIDGIIDEWDDDDHP